MKSISLTIYMAITVALFAGCHAGLKQNNPLVGTWELKHSQASMLPAKDFAANNGNILKFSDSSYERYTNGSLTESGSYTIVSDSTAAAEVGLELPEGQFNSRIVFKGSVATDKTFFQLSNDTLTLISGYFPVDSGSKLVYQKKMDNNDQ